jgi:hypothetical protein
MCLNCKEGSTPALLFPERPVLGSDLWLQAVRAVSIQEDYVKSLERRLEEPDRMGAPRTFIQSLLDDASSRLLNLKQVLKEIDEGG